MSTRVDVGIDGNLFPDVQEFSIDSNILTLADCFEIKLVYPQGKASSSKQPDISTIKLGSKVEIFASDPKVAGGALVQLLVGLVTSITKESDGQGGTRVSVSGADLGWHLVNNCGPLFMNLSGITLQTFFNKVIEPSWGFAGVRADNAINRAKLTRSRKELIQIAHTPVDTFIPPMDFEAGETIADKLILFAKRLKRLVNVSGDGYLQVFAPDYTSAAIGTVNYLQNDSVDRSKNNVKTGKITQDISGVFTDTICVGTVALPSVLPNRFNPHEGTFRGSITDRSVLPFKRLQTFTDCEPMNKTFATDRATQRYQRGLFDSYSADYTVVGHTLEDSFITPDTMIGVRDEVLGLTRTMYCSSRRLMRSVRSGSTTSLTLRQPNLLRA